MNSGVFSQPTPPQVLSSRGLLLCLGLFALLYGCAEGAASKEDASADVIGDGGDISGDANPDAGDVPDTAMGFCGDGMVTGAEECDEAGANSDTTPNVCRTTCFLPYCGDGVRDTNEACDDGNDIDDDACSTQCKEVTSALCKPCATDGDCGRTIDRCISLPGGTVCGVACTQSNQCPEGFECQTPSDGGTNQCLPTSGTCVDCIDADGDMHGIGPLCAGSDCDDDNPEVNTSATEICDGVDNNCNTEVDEGFTPMDLYPDVDGDLYGDATAEPMIGCEGTTGFIDNNLDCDDTDMAANPDGAETCDGVDNDCNGMVDDGAGCPCETQTHEGQGYMFCPTAQNWAAASAACASSGYHLAALNDGPENGWVGQQALMLLTTCTETCVWSGDGDCDDGGPMSDYAICDLGSDCTDCGQRPAESAWVGLTDSAGAFAWENGEMLGYSKWAPGQPDSAAACGELLIGSNEWNDVGCDQQRGYICESPSITQPTE